LRLQRFAAFEIIVVLRVVAFTMKSTGWAGFFHAQPLAPRDGKRGRRGNCEGPIERHNHRLTQSRCRALREVADLYKFQLF
jgi:hypothetical protein